MVKRQLKIAHPSGSLFESALFEGKPERTPKGRPLFFGGGGSSSRLRLSFQGGMLSTLDLGSTIPSCQASALLLQRRAGLQAWCCTSTTSSQLGPLASDTARLGRVLLSGPLFRDIDSTVPGYMFCFFFFFFLFFVLCFQGSNPFEVPTLATHFESRRQVEAYICSAKGKAFAACGFRWL